MATDIFSGEAGPSGGGGFNNYNLAGGGVSDLFSSFGQNLRAKGNKLEAESYRRAAVFSEFNAGLTERSTEIKEAQVHRQVYQGLGATESDVAGGGFQMSGSGLDLLRSAAQQGALEEAVVGETGQGQALGYREQAKSYESMAKAADIAAKANKVSAIGSAVSGGIKLAAFAAGG